MAHSAYAFIENKKLDSGLETAVILYLFAVQKEIHWNDYKLRN